MTWILYNAKKSNQYQGFFPNLVQYQHAINLCPWFIYKTEWNKCLQIILFLTVVQSILNNNSSNSNDSNNNSGNSNNNSSNGNTNSNNNNRQYV